MKLVVDNTRPAPRAVGSYSEAAYFDGNHCQHCADRDEHRRLERIRKEANKAIRMNERRRNGRALFR